MELKIGQYYIARQGTPYFYGDKTASPYPPQDDIDINNTNRTEMCHPDLIKIERIYDFDGILDIKFQFRNNIERVRKLYIPKKKLCQYLVPYLKLPPEVDDYKAYVDKYDEFISYDKEVKHYINEN